MTSQHEMLQRAEPEDWLRRFLVGASRGDVAFATAAGHVLSWRQFRFVYPRYREVAAMWQPPSHGLDALVFHFGAYEVLIPAGALAGELREQLAFAPEYHRLAASLYGASAETEVDLPMEARIRLERVAAVQAKIEVLAATYAFDREPLQHLLGIPGVRIERTPAPLSQVSYALEDDAASPAIIRAEELRIEEELERRRDRAADDAGGHGAVAPEDAERELHQLRTPWTFYFGDDVRLATLREAVPERFSGDPRTYRQRIFLEAVRRRFSTRDLLRSAHALIMNEGYGASFSPTNGDAGPWAARADRLGQHRTAWCLAVRATDGHWRHRDRFVEPRGATHPAYPIARSMDLNLLGSLAQRSAHPYWAPNLAMWSADYDAAIEPSEGLDSFDVEGLYGRFTAEDATLLARIRDSWSYGDDGER